jgi:hypothetical protein
VPIVLSLLDAAFWMMPAMLFNAVVIYVGWAAWWF